MKNNATDQNIPNNLIQDPNLSKLLEDLRQATENFYLEDFTARDPNRTFTSEQYRMTIERFISCLDTLSATASKAKVAVTTELNDISRKVRGIA